MSFYCMHNCDLQYWRLNLRHATSISHTRQTALGKIYGNMGIFFPYRYRHYELGQVRSLSSVVCEVKLSIKFREDDIMMSAELSNPAAAGPHFVEWSAALPPTFLPRQHSLARAAVPAAGGGDLLGLVNPGSAPASARRPGDDQFKC